MSRERDDHGSISVMTAVIGAAALLVFALLVDGTGKMRAMSRADAIAAEAARVALSAVDTRSASISIDEASAINAARAYLAQAGYPGSVSIDGPKTVRVIINLVEPARIGLLGSQYRVTGTATAQLGVGTRGSGNGGLP